jgi:hypothetical protein
VRSFPEAVRELWELLRAYALQELYAPLKGLPLYLGLGLAGALTTVLGAGLLLLGVLRLLQTEAIEAKPDGGTSALPYLIVSAASFLAIALLARRINRQFREPS